jgi:hypothetical protein
MAVKKQIIFSLKPHYQYVKNELYLSAAFAEIILKKTVFVHRI